MVAVALRPYQIAQVSGTEAAWSAGVRGAMLVAATGTGKTTAMGELARRAVRAGETVLFLAHRLELIDQAAKTFRDDFGLLVGIERGSQRAGAEPVVCASVQTLRGKRLQDFPRDAFDKVFVDECHHAAAQSYLDILAWFNTAKVLGVTATPDRADAKPLAVAFETVAHRIDIDEAIESGFLVPVRGIQVTVPGMDLSKVRQRRQMTNGSRERPGETVDLLAPSGQARVAPLPNGKAIHYSMDLHPGDLGRAVLEPSAVEGIVVPMLELVGKRRTIVFAVDLNHAEALAASVCAKRGAGSARVIHYKLGKEERRDIQAAHKAGEFQFLINMVLLTEGYNDPAIECVVMARPTQSRVLYCQAVGRALRLFAGKVDALLLDFVGVGCKFDLVGPEDALGKALVELKTIGAAPKKPEPPKSAARREFEQLDPLATFDGFDVAIETSAPAPAPVTPITFTTKVVALIRGAGRWFNRMLGGD